MDELMILKDFCCRDDGSALLGATEENDYYLWFGRDAADVAISTTFGSAALTRFTVVTEKVEESRQLQAAAE